MVNKRQGDIALSIIVWIVCIVFGIETAGIRKPGNVMPAITISLMAIFAAVIFFNSIKSIYKEKKNMLVDSPEKEPIFRKDSFYKAMGIALAGLVYVNVIRALGYYVTTAIFLFALYLKLTPQQLTRRLILKYGIGTLIFISGLYIVFSHFLRVRTPSGMFM